MHTLLLHVQCFPSTNGYDIIIYFIYILYLSTNKQSFVKNKTINYIIILLYYNIHDFLKIKLFINIMAVVVSERGEEGEERDDDDEMMKYKTSSATNINRWSGSVDGPGPYVLVVAECCGLGKTS